MNVFVRRGAVRFLFVLTVVALANLFAANPVQGQAGQIFWLAPPQVTSGHSTGGNPTYLRLATLDQPATVTISQPANPGFNGGSPIVVTIPANTSYTHDMTALRPDLVTTPTHTVLQTGLKIEATATITAVYEISSPQNPDIWALKGENGLGTEFYIPLQTLYANGSYTPTPYTSFDIVATEDNTTILVYPTKDLDGGHPAYQTFTITLNEGETYSASITTSNPADKPSGTVVLSDKKIAISVKDDSVSIPGQGCRDLIGDQIVPVDIVGDAYIINRGNLNAGVTEYAFVVATGNNTQIYVNGTSVGTLFNGQTLPVPLNAELTYVTGSKPFYLIHVTGFGCEIGMAILPPLNCAGSEQISFVRSTSEGFFLNLLVPAGAEDAFVLNGDPNIITASMFSAVPGTGGAWMGARTSFTTAEIPTGNANLLVNTEEVFSMGLINGGSGSGCRYGYFSEFAAEIIVDAGPDMTVCANRETQLAGSVSGGATQGIWSTNGTGTFIPDASAEDAIYEPSLADLSAGGVILTFTSVSNCFPVEDNVVITYTPAPIVDAGEDIQACENNTTVNLNGFVDIATGGIWSGGAGVFNPSAGNLHAVYTPTAAEVAAGELTLTLTSTGNGICFSEKDSVRIVFEPAPTANANSDQSVCANNAVVQLQGAVTGAGGGMWSGGTGVFFPSPAALGATYTPSALDILNGSVTLTLTTTDNGGCNAVSDQMVITITDAPVVEAGNDRSVCKNNADVQLNGSVSNAGGGIWSGGNGTFSPSATALNAIYTPTLAEKLGGSVNLVLTSTGNGTCNAVSDNITITLTDPPVVNAGADGSICENNPAISLNGSLVGANFGLWTGGAGTFSPNSNTLAAVYTPTPAEITSGSVTLTLSSLDNGNCNVVSDDVTYVFTPAPTANAGADMDICENNASFNLHGTVTGAGGGQWSGGSGSFNPSSTALMTTYIPTASEIASGSVTLTLTTTNNANCNAVSDNITITFTDAPVANAGSDFAVCSNNADAQLNGSVVGATGGVWSGGLGTFTPDANTLNAVYTPTAGEVASGSISLTLSTSGNGNCIAETDNVTIFFTPAPTADAGANQTACANNAGVTLNGSVTIATGGHWSGGSGTYSPNANVLNAVYTPSAAEIAAGQASLTLTTTGNGDCSPVSDQMTISYTPAPTVSAGTDKTVCANNAEVTLQGSVSGASGAEWSGGSGAFSPSATDLAATYIPSAAEIAAGQVILTLSSTGNANCNAVSDQMVITITDAPVVSAGADAEYCANNAAIQLAGSVLNVSGGTWSGGSGVFTPNAATLNAVYTPSQSEINSGLLTLTLTSSGNGNCTPESDDVTFTFSPAPTVSAGADQTLCANNAVVSLSGTVTLATGGTWTGGAGTFASANSLNTTYTPTSAEIANGSVTLTLTTTGNDDCNAVSDSMVVNFTPAPTANAGMDSEVCANNAEVQLNGSVATATGGIWGGGSGTFMPDNTTLNAIYVPSAAEIAAGQAVLTLTTTGNGNCIAVTDEKTIFINPAPVVNAGTDEEFCANNSAIALAGTVLNAGGGTWSGGSGTFTPNSNDLNAVYQPSQTEINNGSVTLTLTSTQNNKCVAVTDEVTYTFSPAPTADAGMDRTLCANNASVSLSGVVTVASGGTWSGGLGIFNPSANSLNATYIPTAAEIASGEITLTLTTSGNDNCVAVSDDVVIKFNPAPVVNAGADLASCANDADVQLNGSITVATGGIWSGGSGTYNPSNTTLNAIYTPSAAEIAAGQAILTLTSTGNGDCNVVTDQVLIAIDPAPVVNAGSDQSICSNNTDVQLNGSVLNAGGGTWSGGLGTYSPSASALNAVYTPTLAEVVSGSITLTLTSTGNGNCVAEADQMTINFTPAPTADAGVDVSVCASSPAVVLNGAVTVASGGVWSGGNGTFSPNPFVLNATYTPTAAERNAGSVVLTLTTTGSGNCTEVSDDITITYTPQPTVNAGANLISCQNNPNVELNGSFTNADGIIWSGGTGYFNPSNTSVDATYIPSAAEIATGVVNLTITTTGNGSCQPATDMMAITINPSPVVSAGVDQSACENNAQITLSGNVQFANGGQWSGGTGTFVPSANALNAVYTPTVQEINAGILTLTLTSTGNGSCNAVTDDVKITFTDSPVADAGSDIVACENNAQVQLNGTFTVAEGAIWSGGVGTFSPSNTTMNAVYTPTQNEINAGSVSLTLTTFGNGDCLPASDVMTISFTEAPVVEAGEDYFACVDNLYIPLTGSVSGGSSTGVWSTSGNGVFLPNPTALNATYIASSQDSLGGQVTLVLTSTSNGTCSPEKDSLNVYISPAGQAHAGPDQMVCANNAVIILQGTISGAASTGVWSTSGSGTFFPNANSLNAQYTPSEADKTAGFVTLTLSANSCNQATDNMVLTITPAPEVVAGADITTCATELSVPLAGFVQGASSTGTWSTTGSGTFTPSPNALNATYNASAEDAENQEVVLILSATGIGNCLPVSDSLTLNIFPAGVAHAGADQQVCENNPVVSLQGSLEVADEGIWTSSGSGVFADPLAMNTTYTPSSGDLNNGSVTLTLTSTNSCNSATDQMTVTFTPSPVVNAGADIEACGDIMPFQISGTVQNATGGHWSSSGNGFFQNGNSLNTYYVASEDDAEQGGVYLYLTSTGNGNCLAVTDSLFISISSGIVVDAGPDRSACIDADDVQLFGAVSNGTTTGEWSTTGNGTFLPNAQSLNAVYQFTQDDIDAGSIEFTLISTNNGICQQAQDNFTLTFGNEVFTFAGNAATVCESAASYVLSGVVSGGSTTGIWSTSGTGTFSPDAESLNATYIPGEEDIAAGSVQLTLTSTNSSVCQGSASGMTLTFEREPIVDAGADVLICSGESNVQLLGSVQNATGGIWSTNGTGTFLPNDSLLTAVYVPSSADSLAGTVTLTLVSYGSTQCGAATDQLDITFAEPIFVNAGADMEICNSESAIDLSGTVVNATGGYWSTSGSGTFAPDSAALQATYTLSAEDLQASTVSIYLTSTGNGECPAVTDTLVVEISKLPVIAISGSEAVCTTDPVHNLSATITDALSFQWTSAGGGTFSPDNTSLAVTYTPTPAEVSAGVASISITATGAGSCAPVTETVDLNYLAPAVVNAGADATVCFDQGSVQLSGLVNNGNGTGIWDSEGFGTFSPDNTDPNAVYVFGANDVFFEGGLVLTYTSTSNGPCAAVADTMMLFLNPAATVNAGPDVFVCRNEGEVALAGNATNYSSVEWSTTGDGVFLPGNDPLHPVYIIGNQDAVNQGVEVILTATGLEGCGLYSDTLTMTISDPLQAGFAAAMGCVGDQVQFTDTTQVFAGEITGWSWDFGTGAVSNQQNPQAIFNEPGSYSVRLVVQSSIGCNDTIIQLVNVAPKPDALFNPSSGYVMVNEQVNFENNSVNADFFEWNFGDGSPLSTETQPSYFWDAEGEYSVVLTASNAAGCIDSSTVIIRVEGVQILPPRLPNSFSPNNDGVNDIFYVRGGPFTSINFTVFDGWGREIFHTTDPNMGWDGTEKGKQLTLGVYVYTVKATTADGKNYSYNGTITLLR